MKMISSAPRSLYFLSRIARRVVDAATRLPECYADPIDHPAIAAMDLGQIADLPLAPQRCPPPADVRPAPRRQAA